MKDIRLTKKLLLQLNACEDGVAFVIRNKLENFPLSLLDSVIGDLTSNTHVLGLGLSVSL